MKIDKHGLLYSDLTYKIRGIVFDIRKEYGPGQKEVIYHRILKEKLQKLNLNFESEKRIPLYSHDTKKLLGVYQPDFVIEECIVAEVKASSVSIPRDEKQLYYYLKNSLYELGFLVNFATEELFIKRIIYTNNRNLTLNPCKPVTFSVL